MFRIYEFAPHRKEAMAAKEKEATRSRHNLRIYEEVFAHGRAGAV